MLYGAVLGDIIGSAYEFHTDMKRKDLPLFSAGSYFTDDTVMTMAVANALMRTIEKDDVEAFKDAVAWDMWEHGTNYPGAGYGYRFSKWLESSYPRVPYNSFGNGSAMRVSPVGWAFDTMEKTREYARASAEVTHNHPEGIKGAEATAAAIFLARTGHSKAEIKKYVEDEFHYDLDRSIDEIRPGFVMDESCQGTVPEAIIGFLEGNDFEDTIRNVISLGGDTDTLGAIAGSIAEAFFGVPEELKVKAREYLDQPLTKELDEFEERFSEEGR